MEGLIFGGAYLRRSEIGLANFVPRALFPGPHHQSQGEAPWERGGGLALQLEVNFPFLLSFTLYLRTIFQVQSPGGLYLEGQFNGGFFALPVWGTYIWRGLYMEGFIFGILR